MKILSWVPVGAVLVACASGQEAARSPHEGQTFREAVQLICDVDARAGIADADDELIVEETRVAWLSEQISNPDGIELHTLVRAKAPGEAAELLRGASKQVELASCPLAESLGALGAGE